jgi:hypothetical protein
MSLAALAAELDAFASGRIDREELRRWLTPYQIAVAPEWPEDAEPPPWSSEQDDQLLFWQLVWLLEDDSVDEAWHRDLARRVLRCLAEVGGATATLDVFPLIRVRDRFCTVVAKHRSGLVSRMGLQSVIAKTFRFDAELREWLAAASASKLNALCVSLAAEEYRAARTLLSLPPG